MKHLSIRQWIWLLLFVSGVLFLGHSIAKADDGPEPTRQFDVTSACYPLKEGSAYLAKLGFVLIGAANFSEGFDELVFANRRGELFVAVMVKNKEICKLANTDPLVGIDQFIDLSKFPVPGESN
jgi:drug/metabolite transporter (DMT)-like permease